MQVSLCGIPSLSLIKAGPKLKPNPKLEPKPELKLCTGLGLKQLKLKPKLTSLSSESKRTNVVTPVVVFPSSSITGVAVIDEEHIRDLGRIVQQLQMLDLKSVM